MQRFESICVCVFCYSNTVLVNRYENINHLHIYMCTKIYIILGSKVLKKKKMHLVLSLEHVMETWTLKSLWFMAQPETARKEGPKITHLALVRTGAALKLRYLAPYSRFLHLEWQVHANIDGRSACTKQWQQPSLFEHSSTPSLDTCPLPQETSLGVLLHWGEKSIPSPAESVRLHHWQRYD